MEAAAAEELGENFADDPGYRAPDDRLGPHGPARADARAGRRHPDRRPRRHRRRRPRSRRDHGEGGRGVLLPGVPRRLLPCRHAWRQRLRRSPRATSCRSISASWAASTWTRAAISPSSWSPSCAATIARVAEVQFRAGYVPSDQSREMFAQACRSIGEPIFGKPQPRDLDRPAAGAAAARHRAVRDGGAAAAPAAAEDHADGRGHGHAAQSQRQHLGAGAAADRGMDARAISVRAPPSAAPPRT